MALQVWFVFFTTFIIYPGVCLQTSLHFLKGSQSEATWFVIIMLLIFAIFDTIGRFAAEYYQVLSKDKFVILTGLKLLLIVTTILISKTDQPSWLLGADWFKITNMSLLSFSNGYCGTCLMIFGPNWVGHKGKERAGVLMNIHLVGGIFFRLVSCDTLLQLLIFRINQD